jgi:hypothetical protein
MNMSQIALFRPIFEPTRQDLAQFAVFPSGKASLPMLAAKRCIGGSWVVNGFKNETMYWRTTVTDYWLVTTDYWLLTTGY